MSNYYEKMIKDAEALMEQREYAKAYEILDTEVKMPYIPMAYEEKIQSLYKDCSQALKPERRMAVYDINDCMELLNGTLEQALQAVELLRASNIRKHLDLVESYLSVDPDFMIRSMLIEILMEQDVTDEIKLDYDGLDITFIPTYVEAPLECDAAVEVVKMFDGYFGNDNPSMFSFCMDSLAKELYFRLPFNLDEDETEMMAAAIIRYVYKAMGDESEGEKFIAEKNLANNRGYELLLIKYEI